jgi:hypothetical protein
MVAGLPTHVTTCLHQCRGNYASRYLTPHDRFTLEWDGHVARTHADHAALERVPRGGATVVLGVERAATHIPLEQLAISPQCGFASALTTGDDDRPDGNLRA